jgi:NACHT domain- and WD repeat-containing protein
MPLIGNIFRVFVSSTFDDLEAERNALHQRVWPRLQQLCADNGARFQAIDLRWGISPEAGQEQKTMAVCLREIDRCREVTPRPNFVVLLGQRYGWRPLPSSVEAGEFERLLPHLSQAAQIAAKKWYQRDNNAVPEEFVLLPRTTDDQDWPKIELLLREGFEKAIWSGGIEVADPQLYGASATEQEIAQGALRISDARDHVYCFFREIEGLPRDSRAAKYLDLRADGQPDLDAAARLHSLKMSLRHYLGEQNCIPIPAVWQNGKTTSDHLSSLCDAVEKRLRSVIEREIARRANYSHLDEERRQHAEFGRNRSRHFHGRDHVVEDLRRRLKEPMHAPIVVHGPSGSGKSALMAHFSNLARVERPDGHVITRFVGATPASSAGRTLLDGLCVELAQLHGDERGVTIEPFHVLAGEFSRRLANAFPNQQVVLLLDGLDQISPLDPAADLSWLPYDPPQGVHIVVSIADGARLDDIRQRFPQDVFLELRGLEPAEGAALAWQWLADAGRCLSTSDQRMALLHGFGLSGCLPLYLRVAVDEARRWRSFDKFDPLPATVPELFRRTLRDLSLESNHGDVLVSHSLAYIAAARQGLSEDELLDVLSENVEVVADFRRRNTRGPRVLELPVVVWSRLAFDLAPYLTTRDVHGVPTIDFFHRQLRDVVESDGLGGDSVARHRALAAHFGGIPSMARDPLVPKMLRRFSELPYHQAMGAMWSELITTLTDFGFIERMAGVGSSAAKKRGAQAAESRVYELADDYVFALERLRSAPLEESPHEGGEMVTAFGEAVRQEVHTIANNPDLTWQQLCNRLRFAAGRVSEITGAEVARRASAVSCPWIELRAPLRESPNLMTTLQAHDGPVSSCTVSPDGKLFASGGQDGVVKIWAADNFREIAVLRHDELQNSVHTQTLRESLLKSTDDNSIWIDSVIRIIGKSASGIEDCAFDGSSILIAVRLFSDSLTVWNAYTGTERWSFSGFGQHLGRVSISDGVIKGSSSNTAMTVDIKQNAVLSPWGDGFGAWDIRDGTVLGSFGIRAAGLAVASERGLVVVADHNSPGNVFALDPRTGASALQFSADAEGLATCAVDPGYSIIITGGKSRGVTVWDARMRTIISTRETETHRADICLISPNGKYLVTGDFGPLKLWHLPRLRDHATRQDLYRPAAFSPGSEYLVCGMQQRRNDLTVREVATGHEVARLTGHTQEVRCCAFMPNGRRIISGGNDGTVRVWEIRQGRVVGAVAAEPVHSNFVRSCAFSADGRSLATADDDGRLLLWNAHSLECTGSFDGEYSTKWAIGPDGTKILSVSKGIVKLLAASDGRELASLPVSGEKSLLIAQCAIAPDGEWAAIRYTDSIHLWNLRDFRAAEVDCSGIVAGCAYTADARYLLTNEMWGVTVRSVEAGIRRGGTLDPAYMSDGVEAFAASPGGDFIVTGDREGRVRTWDWPPDALTAGGNLVNLLPALELRTSASTINRCTVGAGGRIIAAASNDGMIRIWDARDGAVLGGIPVAGVSCIAIHPLAPLLVIGTASGDVHFADLRCMPTGPRSEQLPAQAGSVPVRPRTRAIRAIPQAAEPNPRAWQDLMDAVLARPRIWARENGSEQTAMNGGVAADTSQPAVSPPSPPPASVPPPVAGDVSRAGPTDEFVHFAPPSATRSPGASRKVGRNESCPCGSGRRYKHCHGRL